MSEKPMTELLRKSGIVDKHIAEFEKWRLVEPVEGEFNTSAERKIWDLVKEIEDLLEKEPVIKQTLVAPVFTKAPPRLWSVVSPDERGAQFEFYAVKDEMGRLLADGRTKICRGDTLWCEDSVHENYTVLEVEELYENDKVTAKMITIEKD